MTQYIKKATYSWTIGISLKEFNSHIGIKMGTDGDILYLGTLCSEVGMGGRGAGGPLL